MKFFITSMILVFLCSTSQATKYAPIFMKDIVASADLIIIATILKKRCLKETGEPVAPLETCTGSRPENKLTYNIKIKEILFPLKSKNQKFKPQQTLEFGYTARAHWNVPKDNYFSEINQKHIFYLKVTQDGNVEPVHEAYLTEDLKEKKSVMKLIRKRLK